MKVAVLVSMKQTVPSNSNYSSIIVQYISVWDHFSVTPSLTEMISLVHLSGKFFFTGSPCSHCSGHRKDVGTFEEVK